jgi:hypothetical protein
MIDSRTGTPGFRRSVAGAAGIVTLAVVLSGCSQPSGSPGSSGTTPATSPAPTATTSSPSPTASPTPSETGRAPGKGVPRGLSASQRRVNRSDASSVATGFIARLNIWDTRTDESPHDAAIRAIPLAAPRLASRLATEKPPAETARWQRLKDHDGWTTVVAVVKGTQSEANKHATRRVMATITDHGTDGWSDRQPPVTYSVSLTRVGTRANWYVQAYGQE